MVTVTRYTWGILRLYITLQTFRLTLSDKTKKPVLALPFCLKFSFFSTNFMLNVRLFSLSSAAFDLINPERNRVNNINMMLYLAVVLIQMHFPYVFRNMWNMLNKQGPSGRTNTEITENA